MGLTNNAVVRGALAGAIATVPMTFVMLQIRSLLPREFKRQPLPPEQITANVENSAGLNLDQNAHQIATTASHFGFGAAAGIVYALTADRARLKPWLKGPLFGFSVWAVSYLGLLPAAGLMPKATNEPKERNFMMIVCHLVWGFALSRLVRNEPSKMVSDAMSGVTGKSFMSRVARETFEAAFV
jgi:uncharacterized membrane protein YagU involved in acid resistance